MVICRDNNLSITSMGDIWSFLLILFTSKNISIETTLHTDVESESPDSADDDKRNWVNLRIYKDNPEATDNALLYEMVSKAYYMSKELRDYMRSQALFEYEARHFKSEYDKIPLKQIDHSNISDAEQHKLLVQALKKQFLDSDSDE